MKGSTAAKVPLVLDVGNELQGLSTTGWDPDGLPDDLLAYVTRHVGSDDAVFIVDETGYLKEGQPLARVARQCSATADRIENCQIGVFLSYATEVGRTFLDR